MPICDATNFLCWLCKHTDTLHVDSWLIHGYDLFQSVFWCLAMYVERLDFCAHLVSHCFTLNVLCIH